MTASNTEKFLARCAEVREAISRFKDPLIVGHYDADGLASTALAFIGVRELLGKDAEVRTVRKLDDEVIAAVKRRECIFADFGSGFAGVDEVKDAVIIDHHQPLPNLNTLQANPHLFGIDGGFELSASGTAYCVFRRAVDLAVVGAVADMQYPLSGMNRWVLEEGVKEGRVKYETNLRLFGRVSRPLFQMVLYADDPYLPGLTGDEGAVQNFLDGLGMALKRENEWLSYYDLGREEQKRFVSSLIEYMSEKDMASAAKELIGEVYLLLERPRNTELYDASEFSTLLNACGRNRRPELGIKVCLGELAAFAEAKSLLALHRKNLREGIAYANKSLEDYGKFLFLDARGVIDDGIVGVVAGMLHTGRKGKPVLAVALDENGEIKVSGRGTKKLVEEGLNLGRALAEAAASVGGTGGGHSIAAGASIPKGSLSAFLREASARL